MTSLIRLHAESFADHGIRSDIGPVVLTLGSFDGLHIGHQKILSTVRDKAQSLKDTKSILLSFYPHPSVALKKTTTLPLITTLHQRIQLLSEMQIDVLCLTHFSKKLQQCSWQEFLDGLLRIFDIKELVIGADARIGKGAQGTAWLIEEYLQQKKIAVTVLPLLTEGDQKYASRAVRSHITQGDFATAAAELGRPYTVQGKVVHGAALGGKIGFPTANIASGSMVLPPLGVYVVKVQAQGVTHLAVANIGVRPTVEKSAQVKLEVHLLDFQGTLYGKQLSVEFIKKIRDEKKFNSIDELKVQIAKDIAVARNISL